MIEHWLVPMASSGEEKLFSVGGSETVVMLLLCGTYVLEKVRSLMNELLQNDQKVHHSLSPLMLIVCFAASALIYLAAQVFIKQFQL